MQNNTKAIVVIVFIIGIIATSFISLELYNQETERVLSYFKNHSNEYGALIDKEVRINFEGLYLLKSHFENSEVVTPDEFSGIAGSILKRHSGIQALEWIPKVSSSERASFEAEMRHTFPEFEITERKEQGLMVRAENRLNYYPVTYVKPVAGNEAAIGYDLASNESRMKALKKSELNGSLIATSAITLVQGKNKEKGFLAFLPVYGKTEGVLDSKTLEGFVLGVYSFGSLFEKTVFKENLEGINMQLVDLSAEGKDRILYNYVYKNEKASENRLNKRKLENVGGRTWSMNSYPTSDYFVMHQNNRHIPVFVIGVLISFLLSYLYSVYIGRKESLDLLYDSRERVNSLLNSTAEAIFGLDLDGKCTFVNDACLKILKYDYKAELIGKDMQHLVSHSDDSEEAISDDDYKFHDSIYEGGVVYYDESIFWRSDNTYIPVEYWAHPIRKKGEITGAVVTFFDLTHKKGLEKEAIKAQKLESLGIIAGGIAHDFNNLLTSIIGNITIAKMEVDEKSEVFKFLDDCEKASGRAKELTNQLLTFSKVKMGDLKIFSIEDVLQESRQISLGGSNIIHAVVVDGFMPLIYGDESQISQVFNNLLINAKQAMPRGGKVDINCEVISINKESSYKLKSGEYVKIKFKDEGVGIGEKNLPRIFDPYFTTKKEGSGLGLATSYSIINNHKGSITVESSERDGTTFTILLPSVGVKKDKKTKETELTGSYDGTGKILIMDDEKDVSRLLALILSKAGYDVTTTGNGNEAIEEYRYAEESFEPFDAVILDLTIKGGRGGRETVTILRSLFPKIKAIVSSGYSDDPVVANYKQHGFIASVPKPYATNDMLKTIKEVIEK